MYGTTTYLSFFQVIVASLVLSFSLSGYRSVALDNQQVAFLATPNNDEVLKLILVKGFQWHSNQLQ